LQLNKLYINVAAHLQSQMWSTQFICRLHWC